MLEFGYSMAHSGPLFSLTRLKLKCQQVCVLSSALSCLILVCWRKPARGLKATTVEEAEAGRAVQSVKVLKGKEESDLVRLKEWVRPVSLP